MEGLEEKKQATHNDINIENSVHELLVAVSDYILANDPLKAAEDIITDVLKKIISNNIVGLHIETKEKRNQLETYFTLTRNYNGHIITQPLMTCIGMGGVDVVFLLLHIILLVNHPENPRRILWADEPIKNLSKKKQPEFLKLVKDICNEFGIQIIMSTHESEYIENVDHIIYFKIGENNVTEIS